MYGQTPYLGFEGFRINDDMNKLGSGQTGATFGYFGSQYLDP